MKLLQFIFRSTAAVAVRKSKWQESSINHYYLHRPNLIFNPVAVKKYYVTSASTTKADSEISSTGDDEGEEEVNHLRNEQERTEVTSPENAKRMKISIIGVPNAGKSTITNALIRYDVCPVSKRPHTTRSNQQAIYLDNETQLIFVDTPGLVSVKEIKKFAFKETFVYGPEKSISAANLIAVIHDVSSTISREKLDFRIKGVLQKFPNKKSILILNKIDQVKRKHVLLDCVKFLTCGVVGGKPLPIQTFQQKKESHKPLNKEEILANAKRRLQQEIAERESPATVLELGKRVFSESEISKGLHEQGWPYFSDVFMISALEEDGVDLLRNYFLMNAKPQQWLYDSQTLTNVPPMKLAEQILKAKLLDNLPQEIPFKVSPVLEYWDESESGDLCISFKIRCPKERYKWRIFGLNGTLLKTITEDTQNALISALSQPVKLTLNPVVELSMKTEK